MVLGKSIMVLGRSGLDFSGLVGHWEPGESHQESVTNRQTDNQQDNYRFFESMVFNWFNLVFSNSLY